MKNKATVAAHGGDFQHTLERGVDSATVAAHHAIDSVSKAARPALDHLVSGAHGAVDSTGLAAAHVAETLGEKGDRLNDSGKHFVERAAGYVREHPVASLGMAVATGFLLSRLLSSR